MVRLPYRPIASRSACTRDLIPPYGGRGAHQLQLPSSHAVQGSCYVVSVDDHRVLRLVRAVTSSQRARHAPIIMPSFHLLRPLSASALPKVVAGRRAPALACLERAEHRIFLPFAWRCLRAPVHGAPIPFRVGKKESLACCLFLPFFPHPPSFPYSTIA